MPRLRQLEVICVLVVVFHNIKEVGKSCIGIFVETRINQYTLHNLQMFVPADVYHNDAFDLLFHSI